MTLFWLICFTAWCIWLYSLAASDRADRDMQREAGRIRVELLRERMAAKEARRVRRSLQIDTIIMQLKRKRK